MQSINNKIKVYQDSINNNNLSETYKYLIDYMNQLQREFSDDLSNQFIIGIYLMVI